MPHSLFLVFIHCCAVETEVRYLDIYGAQKLVEKLLEYVTDVQDAQPSMYEKSKNRFRDLANTCKKVVSVISNILQDAALCTDEVEFSNSSQDLSAVIDNMQAELDKLKAFSGESSREKHKDTHSDLIDAAPRDAKKTTMRSMRACLKALSENADLMPVVSECADLLWKWFDIRFYQAAGPPLFRYNMRRIPTWIRDIIVLYGNAVHRGEQQQFVEAFRSWLDSLLSSPHEYAVPYVVYQFNRNPDPAKLSLDAVVIWDILVDGGLRDMCNSHNPLYLSDNMIYDMCIEMNPGCVDRYMDYTEHPEIVQQLAWRQ